MNRVLEISCLLIIWTKIDWGMTINTSTVSYREEDFLKTPVLKNLTTEGFIQELREEKENSGDENVRNVFPLKGKHKWMRREYPLLAEMLFFNISDIKDNEEVNLAQLHLHRRRLAKTHVSYHKRFLPTPYRVALYQVQPNARHKMLEDARTMKLGSLPVSHMTKGGWHTLDVTPVMRELLINAQGPVELLFGIQFEAPKRPDKAYSPIVPIKHFLKNPNVFTPEHPYKASSYLVVFSETDPFFDEFEDGEDYDMTGNVIPTPPPENPSRERHMKRKILKGKQSGPEVSLNELDVGKQDKDIWKFKRMENEVYKPTRKNDGIRHKNKGNEVKRSKADELALMEKTKLKSLPFLHANEVEEIRQTSRRLTRSSTGRQKPEKKSKYAKSELISPAKQGKKVVGKR